MRRLANIDVLREHALRRAMLLRSLSGTTLRYKRFSGAPIRYGGGKSLAVGHILERIPADTQTLVSPFIGGGAVEVACAQQLDIRVHAYDVFEVLVTFWQVLLRDPESLCRRLRAWPPTQAQYTAVKERLRQHWQGKAQLEAVDLAAYYYFNHNLSYGPGFLGWMSKVYANQPRYGKAIAALSAFKAKQLSVEAADFKKSIPRRPHALLYCDPPYYLEGDSKMFKGIYPQRNFPIHHNGFDHKALWDLLRQHRGGFILSYNDCSQIREWYSDYCIEEVQWQYTMGQGETRIGANRIRDGRAHIKKSHELLITSCTV